MIKCLAIRRNAVCVCVCVCVQPVWSVAWSQGPMVGSDDSPSGKMWQFHLIK